MKKWAAEQKALIKKDRHRAANAALLASKKADREKQRLDAEYGSEGEEDNAVRIELEELRAAMSKMKVEAVESKRLRDQIRKQERQINQLKSAQKDGTRGGDLRKLKSPASGASAAAGQRKALGDCTAKHNAKPETAMSKAMSKAPRRKSSSDGRENVVGIQNAGAVDEVISTDSLTEEPTDQVIGVNTEEENEQGVADRYDNQRRPYNAAEYMVTADIQDGSNYPIPALSRRNDLKFKSNDTVVPPFVTAPSPAPLASQGNAAGVVINNSLPAKSQIVTYKNGTQKEVLSDGTTTISFTNGDRKRTYANEKQGMVVYY